MKENLTEIRPGYFLNKNDPQYWRKRMNYKPGDAKAIYQVAGETEAEAERYRTLYKETNNQKYLTAFEKKQKEALRLFQKSYAYGYLPAKAEIRRLKENNLPQEQIMVNKPGFPYKTVLFLLAVLVIAGMTFLALREHIANITVIPHYTTFMNTEMIPYEVKKEKPDKIPNLKFKDRLITVENLDEGQLANRLVNTVMEEYKTSGVNPIKVTATFQESNVTKEVGTAIWSGGNQPIEVFVYPNNTVLNSKTSDALLESTTVIRSALYQYVKRNKTMPQKLGLLTLPFPENYLTSLPDEPYTGKNNVVLNGDGQGGWRYSPRDITPFLGDEEQLCAMIEQSLQPNLDLSAPIPFSPLNVVIDKKRYMLSLTSGDLVFRQYKIGLGAADSTPEGVFYVNRKMMNPDPQVPLQSNVFGTRGLELSNGNYAIHGTNDIQSIGSNKSHGCIRLTNPDVNDLYAVVPLYTKVTISPSPNGEKSFFCLNLQNNPPKLYDISGNPQEENMQNDLHWKA
jgi:hypothetical protein